MEDALKAVSACIETRQPHVVAFCNAHTVNIARDNIEFAHALKKTSVFNDGIGVDLASRCMHGIKFPANLNGTDFIPALLALLGKTKRIYLVGSKTDIVQRAAENLSVLFPHNIVGTHHGYITPEDEQHLIEDISRADPDIILVGMGQPTQEFWATANVLRWRAVILCVGAYLDFAAGAFPRAPAWMRRLRMEWLFRLSIEPKRLFGRYVIGNFLFILFLVREAFRMRRLRDRGHHL